MKPFIKMLSGPKIRRHGLSFSFGVAAGSGLKQLFDEYFQEYFEPDPHARAKEDIDVSDTVVHFQNKYGLPKPVSQMYNYANHSISYDCQKRIPSWSLEQITKETMNGPGNRQNSAFKIDKNIPVAFQSKNTDYLDSGYTRGHMAPAATSKNSQRAMDDTFLLSNILPQDFHNNKKFWYRMELYGRHLAKKYDRVFVLSGPLFAVTEGADKKKYVTYQVIGDSEVAVPSHLFKVFLAEMRGIPKGVAAFVVPNSKIPKERQLVDFKVSLTDVARKTGIEFFPHFNISPVPDLCTVESCKLIGHEYLEFINVSRSLKFAKDAKDLDRISRTLAEKQISVDQAFMELYNEKRKLFLNGK